MDITSLYLRAFFGARPFASSQLDTLAERMGVSGLQSPDPQKRYFITNTKGVTAANVGDKIVFGRLYFESLSDEQRLAVGAHEFAHSLDRHNERLNVAAGSLLGSSASAATAYALSGSVLIAELAFLVSFFVAMGILSPREAVKNSHRELQCDRIAVSFVSSEAMVSSLRLAETHTKPRFPTVEERASAIMSLGC